MRLKIFAIFFVGFVLFMSAQERAELREAAGNRFNPITVHFMPLKDEATFAKYAPVLENYLEEQTGLQVKAVASPDYVSQVKAFSANAADVAIMNPLGYLMARDWTGAQAHLKLVYGVDAQSYRGQFAVRSNSGIQSLKDLQGKKIAFTDEFSTSGYLYPAKTLSEANVKPSEVVFAGSHQRAAEMVYSGEVDAAAMYYSAPRADGTPGDARRLVVEQYPDIYNKVSIIQKTDEIPNGVVAFRKKLPADVQVKLVGSLIEFARGELGQEVLNGLYNATGLALAKDQDYDSVQTAVRAVGKRSDELVPGGAEFYKTHVEPGLAY